jgi:TP901 family phage tail tape measure protein
MSMKLDAIIDSKTLQASIQRGVREYNRKFASKETLKLKIDDKGFRQPLGRITGDLQMFDSALAASNARVIAFGASTAVIGGISKAFKDLAKTTIEVAKSFADINRILQLSTKNFETFGNQLFNISKKNATSFQDTTKAALEFARQGLKVEETLKRTSDALTLVRLTGINADKAVSSLTATVNAFDNAMVTTTTSVNKFVAVETKFAVGARDLVEAIGRVGSSAKDAKVGFDELNAVVTSVQQTTGRGGAVIGNAMKTIFTRLQRQSTLEALESYNVAVKDIQGNTLPAIQILNNFAQSYKGLTDANQAYLREQVAGVFQANILSAILRDLGKQQSTYGAALKVSTAATNEADQATAQLNRTLSALAAQTAAEFKRLQENIGKQTFEPIAKAILDPLKGLMEGINELIDGEGAGSEIANGLLKGIKNVIGGPGLVLIGGILLKVFTNTIGYIGKALPQLVGMTTETQKRATIEQFVSTVLAKEADLAKAIAVNEGNAAEQAKLLLGYAKQTAKQFDDQEVSVNNIVTKLMQNPAAFAAINVAATGKTSKGKGAPRGAGGYMPGMLAEATDIKNGVGGVKKSAMPVSIPNFAFGGGKRGPMIANTGEYIVPNFQGGGSAIFNPNMAAAYGLPSGAKQIRGAGGYVPNFADVNISSVDNMISKIESGAYNDKEIRSSLVGDANKAAGLNMAAKTSPSQVLQKLQRKRGFLGKQSVGNNLDGRGFASMLVPQVGANDPNYRYNFKNAKTQKEAGMLLGGKSGPVNSLTFGVYGLDPNAPDDLKKGGNLAKVDKILDDSLVSAANKVFRSYSPAIGKTPANKERIEKEFLMEGGQGAMEAFKGALFEGLVNRLIGQNLDKKGNTLDVFLDAGGASGKRAKDLFGVDRAVQFADVKSNSGSGNKGKFVKQLLSNAKMLPPMAAARGYVPNFAALGDAVEREAAAGVPLGSIRVGRSSKLNSPNNPAGLAVTNTRDEPRGLKDVVGASRGYVPNYALNLPGGLTVQKGKGHAKLLEDAQKKLAKELNDAINDYRKGNINRDKLDATTKKLIADMKFTSTAEKKVAKSLDRRVRAVNKMNASGGGGMMSKASALNKKMAGGPMGGMGGMMASMALPMLAGGAEQVFGEGSSAGQLTSSALSGAGTGAMIGSFFGPLGTAVGAGVGALGGLALVAGDLGKTFEQLEQEASEYETETNNVTTAAQAVIQAQQDLATAMNPTELEDAQKRLAKNFEAIKGTALEEQFSAAGTNIEAMVEALANYTDEAGVQTAINRASAAAKKVDDTDIGKVFRMVGAEMASGGTKRYFDQITTNQFGIDERDIGKQGLQNLRTDFGKFFKILGSNREGLKSLSNLLLKESNEIAGFSEFSENEVAQNIVDNYEEFDATTQDKLEQLFSDLEDATDGRIIKNFSEIVDLVNGVGTGAQAVAKVSRDADVALKSFTDIRTAMENISQALTRASGLTKGIGKVRGILGNTGAGLFSGAGANIQSVGISRFQAGEGLREKREVAVSEFASKNILKLVDEIKKSQAAVGDEALARLETASTDFLEGNIDTALKAFSEFKAGSKEANQAIQSLVTGLQQEYDLQKTNFEIEKTINQAKFDLEEKKAKNLFNEKTLQNAQRDILFERQKLFLQEQTEAKQISIRDRERLEDPRTFRGRRGASRLALRQNIERGMAERDFGIQQRSQLEEDVNKVASAQVTEQQLQSRLELISTQKTLADKIEELTFEMQKSRDISKEISIREMKILNENQAANRRTNLNTQRNFEGQKALANKDGSLDEENIFTRLKLNRDTQSSADKTRTDADLRKDAKQIAMNRRVVIGEVAKTGGEAGADRQIKKFVKQDQVAIRKSLIEEEKLYKKSVSDRGSRLDSIAGESALKVNAIQSRQRVANPAALVAGLSPISGEVQAAQNKVRQQSGSQRVFAIERQSHDLATEALRTAKSTEDAYKILNGLKKTGAAATNEENILFNANIEKIRQQIELGQIKLVNTKKETDLERDLLFTRQQQLDEEARSFKQSMGAGFDELFQDIDYIYGRLGKDLPKQFRDGMVQALETSMDKAESFGDAMRGFAVDFLKIIRRASLEYSMSNFTSLIGMGASSDFRERMVHEQKGGLIHARNGMYISDGAPSGDSVPAMLEKGEYVLNRKAVAGMGGKAAVDSVNFGMFPRQGGGSMMLNESIGSPRMSGLFLASDNPELAEEREKAAERERKRQEKRAEKDAMKRQFLATLMSTAASTAMAGFSNAAKTKIQERQASSQLIEGSGGNLERSGFSGVQATNEQGTAMLTGMASSGSRSVTTDISGGLGAMTTETVKLTPAQNRVLSKAIDTRLEDIGVTSMTEAVQQGAGTSYMFEARQQLGDRMGPKVPWWEKVFGRDRGRMAGGFMNKDSMPAYLSEGEYVMNNKAVRKYGLGFMGRLNGGVIPGFQEGGPVGGGANTAPLSSGMGATTNNISINVSVGGGGGGQQASNSGNQNADQTSNKDDATQGKELGEKIRAKVLEVISEEQRLGGSLSKTKRQG